MCLCLCPDSSKHSARVTHYHACYSFYLFLFCFCCGSDGFQTLVPEVRSSGVSKNSALMELRYSGANLTPDLSLNIFSFKVYAICQII